MKPRFMLSVLAASMVALSFTGCISGNPERQLLLSEQLERQTITAARAAYVDDLTNRELAAQKAHPGDVDALEPFVAEKQKYIEVVRIYQTAHRAALNGWRAYHAETKGDPTADNLAKFDAAFAAAKTDLELLLGKFLKK